MPTAKALRSRARALYIPHGGGPLPLMGDEGHAELVAFLRGLPAVIGRPSAILVVSAHWEEDVVAVTSSPSPPLYYDYYGFPEEAYRIEYPAAGDPAFAEKVREALGEKGIRSKNDASRGLDHGVFIPLSLMYPGADIPCVQLSLARGLDPRTHLEMGRALAELAGEDFLLLGSGFSFHNLREFFSSGAGSPDSRNDEFQSWLAGTCADPGLAPGEREARLADWEAAPHARYCHPREEHLLPLHVCAGFAGCEAASRKWDVEVMGKKATSFLWDFARPAP